MKSLINYTVSLLISALLFEACSMKLLPYAINEEDYLRGEPTPSSLYKENSDGNFYNPFNFNHDDYGRLLLITTNDHPEIETVELILQNNNKGAVAVIYYHNGIVENYLSRKYSSNKEYVKLDKNWEITAEQDFEYVFTDTPDGIDLKLDITVKDKYRIKIDIQENRTEAIRYNVLATIGAELHQVKRFPLIYMKEMAILPVDSSSVSFEINGEMMGVPKIPIKVEGKTCYRIIYSLERIPFFWNEEQDGVLMPQMLTGETLPKNLEGYTFFDSNGHLEIEGIEYRIKEHSVNLKFSPAFPDIAALRNGTRVLGKFSLGIDDIEGVIGGEYTVTNTNEHLIIEIQPKICWGSVGKKNWAAKYFYHVDIVPASDNKLRIHSEWIII